MSLREANLTHPSQSIITCDRCGAEFDVTWFCKRCPASLCNDCKETHATETTLRDHTVVLRTGSVIRRFEVSQVTKPCQKHTAQDISVYCNDCGVPCCLTCIEKHHRRHDIIKIETKYMECEDELNTLAINLEKHTLTDLRSKIEKLQDSLKKNQNEFENVEKEIELFRKQMKDSVDRSCDKVLKVLNKTQDTQSSVFTAEIRTLEEKIKDIESIIAECGQKIRQGGLDLLEYEPPDPVPYTSPDPLVFSPSFSPGNDIIKAIEKRIGNVAYTCTTPDLARGSIERTQTLKAEVCCDNIASAGNDTVWVANWESDTMYLYDADGKLCKSVSVGKGKKVWNFVVRKSGDLIVCNPDKNIRLVTQAGDVSTLVDTSPFVPRGMCLTTNEEMVVCMADQGDKNHLAMFTPDGKTIMKKIESKDGEGKQMLSDPRRVAVNGECISVMNYRCNVINIEQKGNIRWIYDGEELDLNENFRPRGMCIDALRNLLISDDSNQCIHYVNSDGELIQLLLTKEQHGIEYPLGVCVDNEMSKVWVGKSDKNTLRVYTYTFM